MKIHVVVHKQKRLKETSDVLLHTEAEG